MPEPLLFPTDPVEYSYMLALGRLLAGEEAKRGKVLIQSGKYKPEPAGTA